MTRMLDQLVIIDLECTCWEVLPPLGETNDIIEIGICLLDVRELKPTGKRSILVRPERSKVSPFCTQLTTLTQKQVDQGGSLTEASTILQKQYESQNRVWASYGDYDRTMFEQSCNQLSVPYPFGPGHVNIKTLFAAIFGLHSEVGLSKALEILGLPFEGTHHRAVDDAWNTAILLSKILGAGRPSLRKTQAAS